MNGDLEGRGKMSAPLGELTIFRLEFDDEATYRCEFSNHQSQNVILSVYGKYLFSLMYMVDHKLSDYIYRNLYMLFTFSKYLVFIKTLEKMLHFKNIPKLTAY